MYRLRDLEPDDLPRLVQQQPRWRDTVAEIHGHPPGLCGLVVDDPDGRIAACLVATRHQLTTSNRTIGLGIVRIAHVRQEACIGGVHSLLFDLDSAFAESFEGPEGAVQAVVAQWHEQDVWWFRRLRDFEPIAASLRLCGAVRDDDPPSGVAITALARDAAGVDDELRWRASLPGRRLLAAQRGERRVGIAITRLEGADVVLEQIAIDWADVAAVRALLQAAVAGAARLSTVRWTDQEAELHALQAAGLTVDGPERLIAARISAFGLAPATIAAAASFGVLDVGAEPLPQLSHNETVVTPPPPGTRSTQGDHRRSVGKRSHQSR